LEIGRVLDNLEPLMRDVLAAVVVTTVATIVYIFVPGIATHLGGIKVIIDSAVVFGLLVAWSREFWNRLKLWFLLAVLLGAHIVAITWLILPAGNLPSLAFVVVDVVECGIGLAVIRTAFGNSLDGEAGSL
jgi:hypothetical protein